MSHQFDELGEYHNPTKEGKCNFAVSERPVYSSPIEEQPQANIANQSWRGQCRKLNSICTPWLTSVWRVSIVSYALHQSQDLLPDVALGEEACKIAAPVASSPAQTLLQEFGVVF